LINIVAMNALLRISTALLIFTLLSTNSFAADRSGRPADIVFPHLPVLRDAGRVMRTVDSFLSASIRVSPAMAESVASSERKADAASSRGRICSCQILDLSSANYRHSHVALLAEKTNNGSAADFSIAKNRIEREKKQLRRQFYDKVKTVSKTTATGSCQSMIVQMKSGDSDLQVYEILNADIR
jgi:hypothetical protein